MTNCTHDSVSRADYVHNRPFWKCDKCNAEFIPAFAVAGMVSEEVDTVAAIASAMMWDFHERAVEKYGKDSAVADTLKPGHDEPEECQPGDHIFENHDYCINCGKSRWIGA